MQRSPDLWPALVPELLVSDLGKSRRFYCDLLGFSCKFARQEDGFVYLTLGEAHLMLDQIQAKDAEAWVTGPLAAPLGRGINFQIEVDNVEQLYARVIGAGVPVFRPLSTSWYRADQECHGQTEFLIQDPDGYLLRFMQYLGTRPAD